MNCRKFYLRDKPGGDNMSLNGYQCCFCGDTITSNRIDVTSLIVITNWDKAEEKQHEQQFFCHINCLKERLYDNVPVFLSEE